MMRVLWLVAILALTPARSAAAEPAGGAGGGNAPLRMEELKVRGEAPLRMEELEVRGLRDAPEILYLPVHRVIDLPSPVRYDLFLEDMARPVIPPDGAPGRSEADRPSAPGGKP